MTSHDGLLSALPLRGISVRAGSYGNCGGVIGCTADLEPGTGRGVEVVSALEGVPASATEFPDDVESCVHSVGEGATEALRALFDGEPSVRIVVRRVVFNPVDAIVVVGRMVGRAVVAEALRRTEIDGGDDGERPLRVPIGATDDGEPLHLDVGDFRRGGMGPHGILVGAPGSGKAEALHRIVAGTMRRHSPDRVRLLAADVGGTAGLDRYERLPHSIGVHHGVHDGHSMVKDFDAHVVDEIRRRREGLALAGDAADRDAYESARRAGRPLVPMPRLLIVVDGFSDLIGRAPDVLSTFVEIGRVGRALGLHLLVASDHVAPGRVRGLDGFLSYRIAMRTASTVDSRIVLGVPDACDLPDGHGLLKAGTNTFTRFRFDG